MWQRIDAADAALIQPLRLLLDRPRRRQAGGVKQLLSGKAGHGVGRLLLFEILH
jgi:hypothetical protein